MIERPRLIRLLDECEARTILLPRRRATGRRRSRGNGRRHSTARSGSRSPLRIATWPRSPTTSPRHRRARRRSLSFIDEYLRARSNPQRAAREVARALAEQIEAARVLWIALDDYHEVSDSPEMDEMIAVIRGAHDRPVPRRLPHGPGVGDADGAFSYRRRSIRSSETAGDGRGRVGARVGAGPTRRARSRRRRDGRRCSALAADPGRPRLPSRVIPAELRRYHRGGALSVGPGDAAATAAAPGARSGAHQGRDVQATRRRGGTR